MNTLILCIALWVGCSAVVSAANIAGSGISIENTRISSKRMEKLAHRQWDRRLFIREGGTRKRLLGFLQSTDNVVDSVAEIASQRNPILALQVSDYGIAETPDQAFYHEVTSCVFIERRTGCVLYRTSNIVCVGGWNSADTWKTDDGDSMDMAAKRQSILDRNHDDAELLRPENYNRCAKP